MSDQEKDLELVTLRYQLDMAERKLQMPVKPTRAQGEPAREGGQQRAGRDAGRAHRRCLGLGGRQGHVHPVWGEMWHGFLRIYEMFTIRMH